MTPNPSTDSPLSAEEEAALRANPDGYPLTADTPAILSAAYSHIIARLRASPATTRQPEAGLQFLAVEQAAQKARDKAVARVEALRDEFDRWMTTEGLPDFRESFAAAIEDIQGGTET